MTDGTRKDLATDWRIEIEQSTELLVCALLGGDQSLAIAREVMIDAFDAEAARLMGAAGDVVAIRKVEG